MTRAYALLGLLRLEPCTWSELVECTGWPLDELQGLLDAAIEAGKVLRLCVGRAGNTAYVARIRWAGA